MRTAVIVTGVSGGIGAALRAAFERAGDRVIGLDHRRPGARAGAFVKADLDAFCVDARSRARTLAGLREQLEGARLRALVNNAATQIVKPFPALTADDWGRTLNVNLVAGALLTQAFTKDLERARGSVVNIASIHARLTKPGFAAYATSKAALVGLTRSLAVELGGRVRVNAICPAAIDTPMLRQGFARHPARLRRLGRFHPAGRIGTPAEVAELAVFLASERAGFVTGQAWGLDGGIGAMLHDPA